LVFFLVLCVLYVDEVEVLPRSPALERLGRTLFERRAVSGHDDPIAGVEQVDPFLQQVEGLRQHEPRAAGLPVRKRKLHLVDDEDSRHGRERESVDTQEGHRSRIEDDGTVARGNVFARDPEPVGRKAAEDQEMHRKGGMGRTGWTLSLPPVQPTVAVWRPWSGSRGTR
jgi:hypothetical protein